MLTLLPRRILAVSVVTIDGEMFDGHFFASGGERLTDVLNGEDEFLAFATLGGTLHFINRKRIAQAVPRPPPPNVAGGTGDQDL